MNTYQVILPICGVIYTEVQAESEEQAIEKAMDQSYNYEAISEWDIHRQIVQGNVFHGHTNTASAELIEDEEE